MKTRQDFVTNSSSTSFIISTREDWNEKTFMKAIGAVGVSPMNQIFLQLYDAIDRNKKDIRLYIEDCNKNPNKVYEFLLEDGYTEDVAQKVNQLLSEGRKVYYGRLHSDGYSSAEVYFCMESFILCEDDIYFNGQIGGW